MKRIVSVILSLTVLTGSLSLFACGSDKGREETQMISILKDGKSEYTVCLADSAAKSELSAASSFCEMIKEKTGVTIECLKDKQLGQGEEKPAIVFGSTDSDASKIALEGLGENQIRFLAVGTTLAIVASNPDCLEAAAETFVNEYVSQDKIEVPSDLDRTWQCAPGYDTYTVENPIITGGGADPWVIKHNGTYYYCWSRNNGVAVIAADSIDKITRENPSQVYVAPRGQMYSKEYWAPELHYINGKWYIYVAADDGTNANHRMYVLQGISQDPTKPFRFVGQITDPTNKWAIDGTVLQLGSELYFVWSGWQGNTDVDQRLYIAHMSDPTTIDSERVEISRPTESWEGRINEGPTAVFNGDDTYIVYSANASYGANYCLAYLKLTGDDPMDPRSWTKSSTPFLQRSMVANGPGHCSVVPAPDGSQWVVFHANLPTEPVGWKGRSVWTQKLTFTDDGIKTMRLSRTAKMPYISSWYVEKEL